MGLSHCPLCQALAVLCLVRYGIYASLLWTLLRDPSPLAGRTAELAVSTLPISTVQG
jgi:uncharacterized membrane protein YpjA